MAESRRAEHTRNQKRVWSDLLEIRMRVQPLLELGNRLPPVRLGMHEAFREHTTENKRAFEGVQESLLGLVRSLVAVIRPLPAQPRRGRASAVPQAQAVNDPSRPVG